MSDPLPGVRALDHTADVGLALEAPDLPGLLRAGLLGMAWLLTEGVSPEPGKEEGMRQGATERELDVEARDAPTLLREVLREVLHWHEDEGVVPVDVRDATTGSDRSRGGSAAHLRITLVPGPASPAREIKGVTLHALEAAERPGGGWAGRVIFDV